MNNELKIKQLQWQCRRGMLEVDLFLQRYLTFGYPKALPEEQVLFEQLLTHPDPQLLLWLTCKEVPDDKKTAELITHIRQCCRDAAPS